MTLRNLLRFAQSNRIQVHLIVSEALISDRQAWLGILDDKLLLSVQPLSEKKMSGAWLGNRFFQALLDRRQIKQALSSLSFDAVVVGAITPGRFLPFLPRRAPAIYFLYSLISGNRHKYLGFIFGFVARKSLVTLVVNSHEAKRRLLRSWRVNCRVDIVPLCLPQLASGFGLDSKQQLTKHSVLQVAGLYWFKCPADFVQAARLVLDMNPDLPVCFRLIGTGPLIDEIRSLVVELDLSDVFIVHGHVESNEIQKYFRQATIYVQTSVVENFPLSVLDAMSHGVPSVVTNVGGMPEQITNGKSGFVVPPSDPQAIANAITILLRNPEVRKAMGFNAQSEFQTRFSQQNFDSWLLSQLESNIRPTARE